MTPRKFYELVDPHEHGGGNKECCVDCGVKFLTEKQKRNSGVTTFNKGKCCVCGEIKNVTDTRHYNYLVGGKERTAMQELIGFITDTDGTPLQGCDDIYAKATELLETEKRQIVEAVDYTGERAVGYLKGRVSYEDVLLGEDYFNSKYNQAP